MTIVSSETGEVVIKCGGKCGNQIEWIADNFVIDMEAITQFRLLGVHI